MGVPVEQFSLPGSQSPSLLWLLQLKHMTSKIATDVVRRIEDHVCMFSGAISRKAHFISVHILLAILSHISLPNHKEV